MKNIKSETQERIMGAVSYSGNPVNPVNVSSGYSFWGFSNGWVNNAIQRDKTSSNVAVVSYGNNDSGGDALGGGSSSDFDSGSGYSYWGGFEEQNNGWGE